MFSLFFFHDTAPPEIYTLSLHDALPICQRHPQLVARIGDEIGPHLLGPFEFGDVVQGQDGDRSLERAAVYAGDRKSTRLNSSHITISYAVFCLKKKKKKKIKISTQSLTS